MTKQAQIKKILVRAPNWIGDAVMTTPALAALKALYPSAEITVLGKPAALPVYFNNPAVSSVIEYNDKGAHRGLKGRLLLSKEIKAKGFDLAVLFQNAFDAAFIAFISRIPERAGYARDLRSALLTRPVKLTDEIKKRHEVFYYLNIIKELGANIDANPWMPRLYTDKDESAWAQGFIKENGLAGLCIIACAPGASYGPAKRWPSERFASAMNALSSRTGGSVLIFGGKEDKDSCDGVYGGVTARVKKNLAGAITLRQFIALLGSLNVFLTNDSGAMHLGAAAGTPTVAAFGSTDPRLTGPLGPNAKVVMKKTACSPCFERTCRYNHYDCLNNITVEDVVSSSVSLLKT